MASSVFYSEHDIDRISKPKISDFDSREEVKWKNIILTDFIKLHF